MTAIATTVLQETKPGNWVAVLGIPEYVIGRPTMLARSGTHARDCLPKIGSRVRACHCVRA